MSASPPNPAPGRRSTLSLETIQVDERTAVVVLEGELDLWSAPQFKRTLCDLLAAGRKRLVVDLAGVPFMDSTALGVLVGVERRLANDERLALAQPGAAILRLLELSGVSASFTIFPTREAAIGHMTLGQAEPPPSAPPPLTADAALLLGIASTAMPFAQSLEEQAERWLRALRRHGEAGAVLAALGVLESPISRLEEGRSAGLLRLADADAVTIVTDHAGHIATQRGAAKVGTTHVLLAVIHVYGETFERVLASHAVSLDELVTRLENGESAEAKSQV